MLRGRLWRAAIFAAGATFRFFFACSRAVVFQAPCAAANYCSWRDAYRVVILFVVVFAGLVFGTSRNAFASTSSGCAAMNSGAWLIEAAPGATVQQTGTFAAGDLVFFQIGASFGSGHSF
jgi:hypothetical protein